MLGEGGEMLGEGGSGPERDPAGLGRAERCSERDQSGTGAGPEQCPEWDRSDARSGTGAMLGVGLEQCPER